MIPFSIWYQTGSGLYLFASFIMVLLIVSLFSYLMLDLNRKITINSSGITIKKPFNHISFTWSEITEFRKHEKGVGQWAGWRYFLFANRYGTKPVEIADNNIKGLDELIDAVFDMATNARFIKMENISSIPFLKKPKASQWDRD
jgi:hypothetical protein